MAMREIKLCLLGDSGVGKSSIVQRFVSDTYYESIPPTIGASFMSKTLAVDEKMYKFQIWDTAGQEKYRGLAPMYYRGAAAAIVVYDITSQRAVMKILAEKMRKKVVVYGRKDDLSTISKKVIVRKSEASFSKVRDWIRELRQHGPENIVISIAGNKCDLDDLREIPVKIAAEYAEEVGAVFTETSAKTAANIKELFIAISKKLPPEVLVPSYGTDTINLRNQEKKKKKGRCC